MALRIRFLAFASVATIVSATGALADVAAIDAADDPFLGETPMTPAELREARGGFSIGGFNFNFGVTVTTTTLFPDGLLGDDGLFGEDGLFGDDGLFGEDGVLGDNGAQPATPQIQGAAEDVMASAAESAAAPAPASKASGASPVIETAAAPPPIETAAAPAPAGVADSAPPASENALSAPAAPPVETTVLVPVIVAAANPAPAGEGAALALSAGEAPNDAPVPTQTIVVAPPSDKAVAVMPTAGGGSVQTYVLSPDRTTFVFTNTMDGAIIRQQVDFNIFIPNFDYVIGIASTTAAAARAVSDQAFLGSW